MKGYSELEVFCADAVHAFHAATDLVLRLPERDISGELLRCHEVARVVGRVFRLGFPIEVVDGRYETGAEHSWCRLVLPNKQQAILDPYVVGRLPPVQLVAVVSTLPCRYQARELRTDIREDVVTWLIKCFT